MRAPRRLAFALLALMALAVPSAQAALRPAVPEVGCRAEWDRPTDVLMHTPGDELFLGVVHPEAALFERAFSLEGAAREHRAYIRLLRQHGARVHTVVETLLAGTVDARRADSRPGPGGTAGAGPAVLHDRRVGASRGPAGGAEGVPRPDARGATSA